ncbi:MAG TPA: SH3 domain-containing protein, partial [Aggregatilineales bacterium]|nr:SH3 domain-containing protein [Aggregatilineales bacterium]
MIRLKMGLALLGLMVGMLPMLVLGQSTGVVAEAIGSANLRSRPDTTADKVGEILNGTQYPVVGRSEFFPWVLLG